MHITSSFDREPFDEIKRFLEEHDISIRSYQACEYFVRDFLNQYSRASEFPDDDFFEEVSTSQLRTYWECFHQKFGGYIDWGFHPLVASMPDFQDKISAFEAQLQELIESIPKYDQFDEMRFFGSGVLKDAKKVRERIEDWKELLVRPKVNREQEDCYLYVSKYLAEYFFTESFNEIDVFIHLKHKAYFQRSDALTKNGVVSALNRKFEYDMSLNKKLEEYCKSSLRKEVMNEFMKQGTIWKGKYRGLASKRNKNIA